MVLIFSLCLEELVKIPVMIPRMLRGIDGCSTKCVSDEGFPCTPVVSSHKESASNRQNYRSCRIGTSALLALGKLSAADPPKKADTDNGRYGSNTLV